MDNNTAVDNFIEGLEDAASQVNNDDLQQYVLCDDKRIVSLVPLDQLEYIRAYADPQKKEKCFAILDNLGIDLICHLIAEGAMLIQISKTLHVPYLVFYEWVSQNTDFILKFEAAKKAAADVYSYLALNTLQSCGNTPSEVSLAKQIAAMYSWLAKTYKPEVYTTDTQRAAGGSEDNTIFNINF